MKRPSVKIVPVKKQESKKKKEQKLTPAFIRRQIAKIEQAQMNLQMNVRALSASRDVKSLSKLNRALYLIEEMQKKTRELYFLLHRYKVMGDIQKEIDLKRLEDWMVNKCPKCEGAKLNQDTGTCPNCGYQATEVKPTYTEVKK